MKTIIYVAEVIFVVCVAIVVAYTGFYLYVNMPSQSIHQKLLAENTAYMIATNAMEAHDFVRAESFFLQALSAAKDNSERARIDSYLAWVQEQNGKYVNAVATLQLVAVNTSASKIMRAMAIERMGIISAESGRDPSVTNAIFSKPPFGTLRVQGDDNASFQKLFEYAITFYPSASAEYSVALATAQKIELQKHLRVDGGLSTDASTTVSSSTIAQNIAAGDAALAVLRSSPKYIYQYIDALYIRALLFAKLDEMSMSQGDPRPVFDLLITSIDGVNPTWDGPARINYALYLAHVAATTREAEIKKVLDPMFAGSGTPNNSHTHNLLMRMRTSSDKEFMVRLATSDIRFKQLLLENGWNQADFENATNKVQ